jgi:hypothetical protein
MIYLGTRGVLYNLYSVMINLLPVTYSKEVFSREVKSFWVSHRMFYEMSEGVFGYQFKNYLHNSPGNREMNLLSLIKSSLVHALL